MAMQVGRESGSSFSDDGDEGEESIVAEINITPLVDVFLVLLIIFMVTSSVMSQMGVAVNLPKASAGTAQSQAQGVIISLLPGGGIQVNQQAVSPGDWESLKGLTRQAFEKTTERLVILEGDREAFLGVAIQVMDAAKQAGAERFAIATSPADGK